MSSFGKYTHAIVRGVPATVGQKDLEQQERREGEKEVSELDTAKLQRQLGVYTGILRQKLGLQVIELPASQEPGLPHSLCVEDIVVVQGDTALITRPGNPVRRKEVETVKNVLEELKLRVFEVTDEKATLDGSDVFFTGREFFVGISKWTNHKGAEYVANTFKDFTVSIVHIPEPHHLKSFCSMGGPSTIIIGNSEAAQKAIKAMEQLTDYQYDKLSVPDDAAANCIYARVGNKSNILVHRTADEFPESYKAFKKLPDYTLIPASCTEVAKLGAALSSCSILINKKFEY
ncbi:N(G),N(G)-dimethylarginine dimethylaminohydrolase 1-like [Carcharodon carcharias]|uniref:N(G),N(G)-dimethylarginine dimethylaminohydrolase 1-like n=1 Tax=Carcharodon carcharias TaxID=13397 RepID=UPI001B7F6263|nr:N(G),N(G)-dimethylarginine dimethylaminohydrolase 1-like [Carcharodon carcharias]